MAMMSAQEVARRFATGEEPERGFGDAVYAAHDAYRAEVDRWQEVSAAACHGSKAVAAWRRNQSLSDVLMVADVAETVAIDSTITRYHFHSRDSYETFVGLCAMEAALKEIHQDVAARMQKMLHDAFHCLVD